jgi:hypothetical protein
MSILYIRIRPQDEGHEHRESKNVISQVVFSEYILRVACYVGSLLAGICYAYREKTGSHFVHISFHPHPIIPLRVLDQFWGRFLS